MRTQARGAAGVDTSGDTSGADLSTSRRQMERYTISSHIAAIVILGLVLPLDLWGHSLTWDAWLVVATLAVVAMVGAAVVAVWQVVGDHQPGRRPVPIVWVTCGLAVIATTASAATKDPQVLYEQGAGAFFPALLPTLIAFSVVGLAIPWRRLTWWCLAAGALVTGAFAAAGVAPLGLIVLFAYGVGAAWCGAWLGSITAWTLRVVARLDDAREAQAGLAVARERLRFSRDLHDVYGRTLSAIAVKSDLAAELATRGDARAAEQMREVRQLAQSSLTEVRALVAGYREVSLDDEVAGAAALLRSAGARVEIAGLTDVGAALGAPARTALAWVVREAVTNVIRHSTARTVRLVGSVDGATAVVTITNDGAGQPGDGAGLPGEPATPGSGLRGLSERVGAAGGTVQAHRDGELFVLVARLPAHG